LDYKHTGGTTDQNWKLHHNSFTSWAVFIISWIKSSKINTAVQNCIKNCRYMMSKGMRHKKLKWKISCLRMCVRKWQNVSGHAECRFWLYGQHPALQHFVFI